MYRWDNFDEALDWIYSFTNLERDQEKRKDKKSFLLEAISRMNQYFHYPDKKFKIIHVAGSKGKGTISYLIAKYFQKLGYKVGLYTSPHVFDVTERIKINGVNISEKDFLEILSRIYDYVIKLEKKEEIPSFFDIFTELAFLYFYEQKVDLAIIEVGLGGRLDSTNIVKPILSVISSITYEHTEVLGKTLPKIASEKAGIIKENIPVVLGKNKKNVFEKIKKIAEEKGANLFYSNDYFKSLFIDFIKDGSKIYSKYKIEINKSILDKFKNNCENVEDEFLKLLSSKRKSCFELTSSLIGSFQDENIETAICSIFVASQILKTKFSIENIKNIMKNAYWPSRFEIFNYEGKTLILDGAHTEDSIKKLVATIRKLLEEDLIKPELATVVGMMKDKNHEGILKSLFKISNIFYFVELDKWKDSKVSNYLNIALDIAKKENKKIQYYVQNGVNWKGKDIIDKIIKENNDVNTILITGSLYLAQYFRDFQDY